MSTSRELFLRPIKLPNEKVRLPELGDDVTINVVGFTAAQRADFEYSLQTAQGKPSRLRQKQIRERLVVACCRDDDGNQLFTEADIESIGNQSAVLVERITNAAMRVCGMTDNDIESMAGN